MFQRCGSCRLCVGGSSPADCRAHSEKFQAPPTPPSRADGGRGVCTRAGEDRRNGRGGRVQGGRPALPGRRCRPHPQQRASTGPPFAQTTHLLQGRSDQRRPRRQRAQRQSPLPPLAAAHVSSVKAHRERSVRRKTNACLLRRAAVCARQCRALERAGSRRGGGGSRLCRARGRIIRSTAPKLENTGCDVRNRTAPAC